MTLNLLMQKALHDVNYTIYMTLNLRIQNQLYSPNLASDEEHVE